MNAQYAVKGDDVYVLEVNPRASRTVPFVAKATGRSIAAIAARVMAVAKLRDLIGGKHGGRSGRVAVKEAVFPFARFPAVDVAPGPEMRSTGEAMGLDEDFARAFAKAQLAAGVRLPESGTVFISVKDDDKAAMAAPARRLRELGYGIVATGGAARFLRSAGVACGEIRKVLEGGPHVVDAIGNGEIALVLDTTGGARAVSDSSSLRRAALTGRVPCYTTAAGARAAVRAMETLLAGGLDAAPLHSGSAPPAQGPRRYSRNRR